MVVKMMMQMNAVFLVATVKLVTGGDEHSPNPPKLKIR